MRLWRCGRRCVPGQPHRWWCTYPPCAPWSGRGVSAEPSRAPPLPVPPAVRLRMRWFLLWRVRPMPMQICPSLRHFPPCTVVRRVLVESACLVPTKLVPRGVFFIAASGMVFSLHIVRLLVLATDLLALYCSIASQISICCLNG